MLKNIPSKGSGAEARNLNNSFSSGIRRGVPIDGSRNGSRFVSIRGRNIVGGRGGSGGKTRRFHGQWGFSWW